jgi:hypothetical protein
MAQNYIRQSSFTDGDTITASLFNNEYEQLVNAFAYSAIDSNATGHTHDGSLGQGGNISKIGDIDFLNKIEIDGTNNRVGFFVEVGGATTEQVRISDGLIVPVTTNDIDLGTSSLQFKDLYLDGTANIDGLVLSSGSTVTAILDEDTFSSDSATALATQQSIKAYVDAQVTAQDLDIIGDTGGALSIDLDSETLTIAGGTGIDTSGATNTLTVSIDSTVATLTGTQTLTNKTIDADSNTISNIEVDNLKSGVLDTDISSVAGTHTTLPSALAVKTYVDAQVTAQDLDIVGDTGTDSIDLDSETITFTGGTGLTSTVTAGTVTFDIDTTVATLTGTQTLTNKTIDASSNTISNIDTTHLASGVLDTDLSTVSSLDNTIPSAKAVVDYVADLAGSSNPIFTGTVTADNVTINGNTIIGSDTVDTLTVNANSTFAGTTIADLGSVTTADINGGTIDGTVIGGTSAAAGSFTTLTASGEITANGGIALGDNDRATFGGSDDLQIYHDGTNSVVGEVGTGNLYVQSNGAQILLQPIAGEQGIVVNSNADVGIYYDNSLKLATTATGVDVTGTVTADSATIQGATVSSVSIQAGDTTSSAFVYFGDSDAAFRGGLEFKNTDESLNFYAGGLATPDMTISTAGNVDIAGTVTTGGTITVNAATASLFLNETDTTDENTQLVQASGTFRIRTADDSGSNVAERLRIDHATGDISFYEDTGTTAKFFWDASAESLLIGQTDIPTGLGASNTKLILGSVEDSPEFVAYNSDNSIQLGDKIGAYLFGNDDNNATEDHFAGMWAKSASTTGAMDIHFAAGKSNYEDDSPHMTLDSSGNVGIGNTSPSYRLSVGDGTADTRGVFASNNAFSIGVSNASGFAGWIGGSGVTDNMVFSNSGGTERMRIDASGNVGIGTSSPAGKQHTALATSHAWGAAWSSGTAVFGGAGSTSGALGISYNDTDGAVLGAIAPGVAWKPVDIRGSEFSFSIAGTEKMRIDASGNVGIGTSSPANKLDVTGTIGVVNVSSSTGTNYAKVQVNNAGGSFQFGIENSAGSNYGAPAYSRVLWNDGAYPTVFYTSSTERMRIDSSGRIVAATGSAFVSNTTTTSTSKTLTNGEQCVVDTATQTLTLPASPSTGDNVSIFVGDFTDTIVARNGSNIMGLAEDLTIDSANVGIKLVYVDASNGWRILV